MKIIVAIKQVPVRDSSLHIDSSGHWIDEDDLSYEINEPDAYALEAALQLKEKEGGGALRLVSFAVDASDADCLGDEPIWHDGQVVGWVTSGAYGHTVKRSLALGYVPASLAATSGFEIEIIGERHKAERLTAPAFDADGSRMRI